MACEPCKKDQHVLCEGAGCDCPNPWHIDKPNHLHPEQTAEEAQGVASGTPVEVGPNDFFAGAEPLSASTSVEPVGVEPSGSSDDPQSGEQNPSEAGPLASETASSEDVGQEETGQVVVDGGVATSGPTQAASVDSPGYLQAPNSASTHDEEASSSSPQQPVSQDTPLGSVKTPSVASSEPSEASDQQ